MHKLITAIITPFNDDLSINYEQLQILIDDQVNNNVDGIVINGTTSESPTLSKSEKRSLVEFVINHTPDDFLLIVGVSSNDTLKVIDEIKNVDDLQFDSYMVCPPYYNKTSQAGLIIHYQTIINATSKNFVIYNIPGRCGINIEVETMLEICKHEQVTAIKEASGDISYTLSLLANGIQAMIYNGNDDLIVPMGALKIDGIISAISNAIPRQMKEICENISDNDIESASSNYLSIHKLVSKSYEYVNPIGVKALTSLTLNISDNMRLPLVKAPKTYYEQLEELQ